MCPFGAVTSKWLIRAPSDSGAFAALKARDAIQSASEILPNAFETASLAVTSRWIQTPSEDALLSALKKKILGIIKQVYINPLAGNTKPDPIPLKRRTRGIQTQGLCQIAVEATMGKLLRE